MKRATLHDVAARAGVSAGTVSNVLNRPAYVSDQIRMRVERAIAELDYVPRDSARQFRAGRVSNVGLVLADMGNPFFIDLALGAEAAARSAGAGLVVCNSGEDEVREAQNLDLLIQQRVQGIVLAPVASGSHAIARLHDRGVPLVIVDRISSDSVCCAIGVDDDAGGALAGEHIIDRGHTRVGFVGDVTQNQQVAARFAGFARVVERRTGRTPTTIRVEGWTLESGRGAGRAFVQLAPDERPSAVFCANDLIALGVLQELTRAGLQVPRDLAIVGFDDIAWADAAAVPLTTISQPRREVGEQAIEFLLDEIRGAGEHRHRRSIAAPLLVARRSTEPAG